LILSLVENINNRFAAAKDLLIAFTVIASQKSLIPRTKHMAETKLVNFVSIVGKNWMLLRKEK